MSLRATAAALAFALCSFVPAAGAATVSPYLLARGALPVNDQTFSDYFEVGWGGALGVDVSLTPGMDLTLELAGESYDMKIGAPTGTGAIVSGDRARVTAFMVGGTYHAPRTRTARPYVRLLLGLEHASRAIGRAESSFAPPVRYEWPADTHLVPTLGVGVVFRRGERRPALRVGLDAMLGGSSDRKTGRFAAGLGLGW